MNMLNEYGLNNKQFIFIMILLFISWNDDFRLSSWFTQNLPSHFHGHFLPIWIWEDQDRKPCKILCASVYPFVAGIPIGLNIHVRFVTSTINLAGLYTTRWYPSISTLPYTATATPPPITILYSPLCSTISSTTILIWWAKWSGRGVGSSYWSNTARQGLARLTSCNSWLLSRGLSIKHSISIICISLSEHSLIITILIILNHTHSHSYLLLACTQLY